MTLQIDHENEKLVFLISSELSLKYFQYFFLCLLYDFQNENKISHTTAKNHKKSIWECYFLLLLLLDSLYSMLLLLFSHSQLK
jgi:hypothetical protein